MKHRHNEVNEMWIDGEKIDGGGLRSLDIVSPSLLLGTMKLRLGWSWCGRPREMQQYPVYLVCTSRLSRRWRYIGSWLGIQVHWLGTWAAG